MQTPRQNELNLGRPLFDGVRFRLPSLVILLEIVRKVAVQIETSGVVSPLSAFTLAWKKGMVI